jgi:hypothetical protein
MDSVRFGRALGVGARAAAKTLVTAVDAATSPNPSATKAKQSAEAASAPASPAIGKAEPSGVRQQAAQTTAQVRQTGRGLKEGSKRFRKSVGEPVTRLSAALWLELTGVFFGIFAVFAASGAWKMRTALHETANRGGDVRFLIAAGMAAVFGYFSISSFVKANRRVKRR